MNLTKLAINFAVTHPSIDITLVSMVSTDIIAHNVSYLNDLNETEAKVLNEIRNKWIDFIRIYLLIIK